MPIGNSEPTEKRLLVLAAQGNKNAFGLLYERYIDEIYRFVYFSISDRREVEEITENVFLKSWEQLPIIYSKESQTENFRAWLYRIARNMVTDFLRSKKPFMLGHDLHSDEIYPEILFAENNLSNRLIKAIMQLELKYRQIIVLRFINQISHKEVAQILRLGYSNVRVLQHQALMKIREILPDEES